jgi:predicted nucleic acid-binding protein
MAVLDASALIALLRGEPGGAAVGQILHAADSSAAVSALNLAESVDVLVRVFGIDASDVGEAFDLLELGGLVVMDVDGRTAWRAGLFRAANYRKGSAEISLADAMAAISAQAREDALVTSDRTLARVARAAGIEVLAIPDRFGPAS